jgi:hypothetical protein
MVCEVNGIIEFYAHAIPFLASTRKKGVTAGNDETVSITFPGISIDNRLKGKTFLLKENLRVPRGPDS